jgi:hypothetical protein
MVAQVANTQADGQNVIAEYDDSDNLQRYYVHGSTYVDEHVLMNEQGRDYFYLLGLLYSVVGLTNDVGDVVQRGGHSRMSMDREWITSRVGPGLTRLGANMQYST